MTPKETWTDERLDDLNKKVEDGFARADRKMDAGFARADKKMDDGFARADKKMDAGFARVDKTIAEVKGETAGRFDRLETRMERQFGELNERFDRMQHTLFAAAVAVCVALIGSTATLAGIALF